VHIEWLNTVAGAGGKREGNVSARVVLYRKCTWWTIPVSHTKRRLT